MTSTDLLAGLDLADPQTYQDNDMTAVWREYRRQEPVRWHPGTGGRPGFWVLSRHQDTLAMCRDTKRFTIERGNILATLLAGGDSAGGRMVAVTDGQRHKELRGAILKSFSNRALAAVAERITTFTDAVVAEVAERGDCDFAPDAAARISMNTISDLLDVPQSDRAQLLALNKRAVSSDEPGHTDMDARLARSEIVMYFADLVEQRRARPGEDAISMLASTKIEGESLSSHDLVLNAYGLLVAGEETSRLSMIDGVHALAGHPGQWAALRAGEVDLATATEEVFRWSTPIMHLARTATEDVEFGDRTIRAGEIVTAWTSSANRDEEVFADPDSFDLARSPNKHVAFGFGTHFCLGVYLARVEVTAMLAALCRYTAGIELTGPPRRIYSNVLDGFSSLPVRLHT